jgi:pyruvate/2-oxoglutarate dehydrogenase complex dihydrolipoamide acyltransferase (E2) component
VAKVTMPQLGESVAEGTIGKWLKKPGDTVAKYEPLLEVITDKVNAEVPSPFAGVLREILVEEGATVPNNAEIAVIETADDGEAPAAGSPAPAAPVATEKQAAPSEPETGGAGVEVRQPAGSSNGPAGSDERRTEEMPDRAAAGAPPHAPAAAPPPPRAGGY